MRRLLIIVVIFMLLATGLSALTVRVGITAAAELAGEVNSKDFFDNIADSPLIVPGVYWEIMFDRIGFGMTYMAKFNKIDELEPATWTVDWIGSFDFRYHFITKFFLEPFIELGIGCAGSAKINNLKTESGGETYGPLTLSVFFQAGGGVVMHFDSFHAGARLVYRLMNEPIPATDYDVYPLYKLQGSLFAGLSF